MEILRSEKDGGILSYLRGYVYHHEHHVGRYMNVKDVFDEFSEGIEKICSWTLEKRQFLL